MDWGALIGPAVVAAAVSGIVAGIGFLVNRSTTLATHREKLQADQRLAERKVEADIDLARAKFDYDRQQAVFRRRFELAEHILSDAYRFNDLMSYVRNGFAFEGEGMTRKSFDHEREDFKRTRNSYFVPIERLKKESAFISSMMARRHSSRAHFGDDAEKAFDAFHTAVHRVQIASSTLANASDEDLNDREFINSLQCDIWQGKARIKNSNHVGEQITIGVDLIEKICRPVLEMDTRI